jgi:hypothetical protein
VEIDLSQLRLDAAHINRSLDAGRHE